MVKNLYVDCVFLVFLMIGAIKGAGADQLGFLAQEGRRVGVAVGGCVRDLGSVSFGLG